MKVPSQNFTVSILATIFVITAVLAMTGLSDAHALPGSYVESVTFQKQGDPYTAVDNLIAGDIDMYYQSVLADNAKRVSDAGHNLYSSYGDTSYSLYLNPVDDYTHGFNPLALQKARLAFNYMVDRDHIVDNILGSGEPMYSTMSPYDADYLTVYRELGNFGFEYDLDKAEQLFADALTEAGASRHADDTWYYGGAPIEITIFIRDDQIVRHAIGENLADTLDAMGLVVNRVYGDLRDAYATVYSSDPLEQRWHIYVESYHRYGGIGHSDYLPWWFYAPLSCNLPGECETHNWEYENDELDAYAYYLATRMYDSPEQRAALINGIVEMGVQESVRVFLAVGGTQFPVSDNVEGVVNVKGSGIANRYTPINAQLTDGETNLDIGMLHLSQGAWNPVGGFQDVYSYDIWSLLSDTDFVRNPHTLDIHDSRNVLVSVDTAGPDGKVKIPPGTIIWDPDLHMWASPKEMYATSKVTVDLKLANWHHGQPMDVNDLLYPIVFNKEHRIEHTHGNEDVMLPDEYSSLPYVVNIRGVNVLDDDTLEIYLNFWHYDEHVIAAVAGLWTAMPWEVLHVMDRMVHDGDADWYASDAAAHSGNWLDMIDNEDAAMAVEYLEMFKDSEYENHVPYFLYENMTSDYVTERYDAAISWMREHNHMAISNGPFYMDSVVRDPDDGNAITRVVLNQFDDPTYPLSPEMWSSFTDSASLSGDIRVGALASTTGNAVRYGEEIDAATKMAVADFNDYLEMRSAKWRLSTVDLDTKTSPDVALDRLISLNEQGVKIATGPSVDVITPDILRYANDNDMTLLSCCSSAPSASLPNDALFRMLPDQRTHAAHIVDLMTERQERGVYHLVPVAINAGWAKELLLAAKADFESRGGVSSDVILYQEDAMREAASVLASRVMQAVGKSGAANVAVLYVGFGEGPDFLKAAASFDILHDVRWFGADQNTASPNIADDVAAAAFADSVDFTVVQPTVYSTDTMIYGQIKDYLEARGIEQSPYSSYQYDAVWLLGLSILHAQSADSLDVREQLPFTAMNYVGAIGSAKLDDNGDRERAAYWEWELEDGDWIPYVPPLPAEPQKICR